MLQVQLIKRVLAFFLIGDRQDVGVLVGVGLVDGINLCLVASGGRGQRVAVQVAAWGLTLRSRRAFSASTAWVMLS